MRFSLFKIIFSLSILCASQPAIAKEKTPIPRFADISISGVFLEDATSLSKQFPDLKLNWKRREGPWGILVLREKTSDQVLVLIHHPGAHRNSFSEIEVSKDQNRSRWIGKNGGSGTFLADTKLKKSNFRSGKGIRLGMSVAEVIEILGPPHQERKLGPSGKSLKYGADENSKDEMTKNLLESYNMPLYFGEYNFEKDSLVHFTFGFEYP